MPHCKTCGSSTNDFLATISQYRLLGIIPTQKKELIPYCRPHLIEEFGRCFAEFKFPIAVYHPHERFKEGSFTYLFEPCSRTKNKPLAEALKGLKRESCRACSAKAEAIYFDASFLDSSGYPKADTSGGKILCRKCALSSIKKQLLDFPSPYDEGLFCPYDGEGAMYAVEV